MKTRFILLLCLVIPTTCAFAQGRGNKTPMPNSEGAISSISVEMNRMDTEKQDLLDRIGAQMRSKRGVVGVAMLSAGASAALHVAADEIMNLTQIRSTQKKTWLEMRQKECVYEDSIQSIGGQNDFYGSSSAVGPLDPSDMIFDGINISVSKNDMEVIRLSCSVDSSRFAELYLQGRFYLVLDSFVFHPYQSFLPNMEADWNEVSRKGDYGVDVVRYWEKISQFDFKEQEGVVVRIWIDIYSSWINELAQVFDDVKLGSFKLEIPIREHDLKDSVYVYSRGDSAYNNTDLLVDGSSFVVPRSYMSIANRPSWGTGRIKMKVRFSETCRFNPRGERAQNWKKDYKRLKQLKGNNENDYIKHVVTTFRESGRGIIKATYTPALGSITTPEGNAPRQKKGR